MGIFIVPKIGTTAALRAIIAGQLTMAVILDHYGLFDLKQIAITPLRIGGVALLALGTLCIVYKPA
jgi:transporter family-2 protein